MNGATAQMHHRADRLHDGARHQVGGHRRERQHVEEQHEHRRHQSAASHAGEADDNADSEGGDRQGKIESHEPPVCHNQGTWPRLQTIWTTLKEEPERSDVNPLRLECSTAWLRGCVTLDPKGFIKTGPDLLPEDLTTAKWPLARPPHLLETSLPGVFAVGDVRGGSVKRVASAVGEGSIAVAFVHRALAE